MIYLLILTLPVKISNPNTPTPFPRLCPSTPTLPPLINPPRSLYLSIAY